MTIIVNLKHCSADVICDRTSIFGNPFLVGKYTREEACNLYAEYFHKRILTDKKFYDKVLSLKNKKLGCWCRCIPECGHSKCKKQLRCHCETIVNWLNENYDSQRTFNGS